MARVSKTDRQYLEMHGGKWRVTLSVPTSLQPFIGATKLKQSLHTDSLAVAKELRWGVIAQLKAKMQSFKRTGKGASAGERNQTLSHAIEIATHLRKHNPNDHHDLAGERVEQLQYEIRGAPIGFSMETPAWPGKEEHNDYDMTPVPAPIYDPDKERLAEQFFAVAMRGGLPIDSRDLDYKAKRLKVSPRTRDDHDRALTMLTAFCIASRRADDVKSVDDEAVADFIAHLENERGLASRTIKKYVSRLSLYFAYLKSLRDVKVNPWRDAIVYTPTAKTAEEERPFTQQEVVTLLTGPAKQVMRDLMMMGALTGARLDAIVDLKVGDVVENEAFRFKPQKREKGHRYVPIHPDLMEIVRRRTLHKTPSEDFFPEYPQDSKNPLIERSFRASKHFTTYRRSLKVNDMVSGKRRSRVNFHSFRRWFVTTGENVPSVKKETIAALVGHARQGMTLGVYSAGPEWKAARRAVNKIRLPPLDGSPVMEPKSVTPRTELASWS